MEKIDVIWKIFMGYMLVILFVLLTNSAFGQIKVIQFNADWNKTNEVDWAHKLTDIKEFAYVDIGANKEAQKKYKIAVIPTIIVFNGKEFERFQADLSFAMQAKLEDIQDVVDEILMEDF